MKNMMKNMISEKIFTILLAFVMVVSISSSAFAGGDGADRGGKRLGGGNGSDRGGKTGGDLGGNTRSGGGDLGGTKRF